ncbi:MAG: tRNA (guanosine(37)-N1)-methyltransferase TrmD [Candidatus Omnitrophica bacterium]|nr:tRNA (guanosine(37)-N1)-methyltransferase TrmD [Candidatus Omnitrophota bacterium]
MVIEILTLFPKMFEGPLGESMMKRAQRKGAVKIRVVDLRRFSRDKHKKTDDRPFGGGPGMVLSVEPIHLALVALKKRRPSPYVILLSAGGKLFTQRSARRLSKQKRLIFICGHYEGVDERVKRWVDEEISIGEYVLTCGEIPAMVIVDCVTRLLPGVLGDATSSDSESFEIGFVEYPHYTRPRVYQGMKVPGVLLSGDHEKISEWRMQKALLRTLKVRPELLKGKFR